MTTAAFFDNVNRAASAAPKYISIPFVVYTKLEEVSKNMHIISFSFAIILLIVMVANNESKSRKDIINAFLISIAAGLVVDAMIYFINTHTEVFELFRKESQLVSEPKFVIRTSERYNYQIACPADFIIEGKEDEDSEEDFNLTSTDYRANLRFTARFAEQLPESFTIGSFRKTYGGIELESDGWYAVSTKASDGEFHYRKCIYTHGIVRMYTFSFPADQENIYINNFDYITYIEKSFKKLK